MYDKQAWFNFRSLGQEIKRKRESIGWTQEYEVTEYEWDFLPGSFDTEGSTEPQRGNNFVILKDGKLRHKQLQHFGGCVCYGAGGAGGPR